MCAPASTAAVTAAAVAQSRRAAGTLAAAAARARNDLRDGPTTSGRPELAELVEPRQHLVTVRRLLRESQTRDRRGCAPSRRRRPSRTTMLSRSSSSTSSTTSWYEACSYMSRDRPRVCIRMMAAPRRATTSPSAGSYRRPLMSLTMRGAGGESGVGSRRFVGVDWRSARSTRRPALRSPASRAGAPPRHRSATHQGASIRRRRRAGRRPPPPSARRHRRRSPDRQGRRRQKTNRA